VADEPLSICLVTTFYPPFNFGGDGIHVQRLAGALARRGHSVTVVHSADAFRTLGGKEKAAPPDEPGVTVRTLATRFARGASLATYLSGKPAFYADELAALFAGRTFDVVHFHNVSLVGGPGVLRYGDGVKLYTTHEHWLVCPMHVLFRDNREPCFDPHCFRCSLHFGRPPQLWRYSDLLERSLSEVDLFLAPSQFTIEAHRTRGFTHRMRRLAPFVPEPVEAGEAFDGRGRPYFLFVGRLERLKGVQVLVDVFRKFREADLVVAGEGTFGGELRRRAKGLDHVHFLGSVGPARLDGLYRGAVSLLIPSVGFETFGIVGVEAMARRTPIIVNDLGALPELVSDSGGGLVYGTTDELVGAMRRVLEDGPLRDELGERGQSAWRKLWTEEAHLAGYFGAIAEARELAA
jgi:glycosyltransferase involved in cell wall biosynthesis